MQNRAFPILRWVSIGLISLAVVLTALQLVSYSRIRASFPPGMQIAGVNVAGLDRQRAAERLTQAYGIPVEVRYGDASIQIKPSNLGFQLDLESMMAAADQQRLSQPFWSAFWDYLWNQLPKPQPVPLRATISEERMRAFLANEVAARYDRPAQAAMPKPGSTDFLTGQTGTQLDVDRAVVLLDDALRSPSSRVVNLSFQSVNAPRPSLQNLEVQLKQVIDVQEFDGLVEVYLLDLQTYQEINFARLGGVDVAPGVAFTAASTMKIPIMMSIYSRVDEPTPTEVDELIKSMIELSQNDPADRLMEQVMDKNLGPLQVSEDLTALGLQNTFLAGYFYPGAPLLQRVITPANSRTDVSTQPDVYNQTTAAEMGMLLTDLYQCADSGGGALSAVFQGEITQTECRQMVEYLTMNLMPALLSAGLPEGTRIAHKHGWITEFDGYIHTFSDAGIIYSPGGSYVLVVYSYHPVQLVWDTANLLMADISMSVYNYFNIQSR